MDGRGFCRIKLTLKLMQTTSDWCITKNSTLTPLQDFSFLFLYNNDIDINQFSEVLKVMQGFLTTIEKVEALGEGSDTAESTWVSFDHPPSTHQKFVETLIHDPELTTTPYQHRLDGQHFSHSYMTKKSL